MITVYGIETFSTVFVDFSTVVSWNDMITVYGIETYITRTSGHKTLHVGTI